MWGGKRFKAQKHAAITFPGGAKILADVAQTPVERERGLMYYKKLPKKYGMLFVFPAPSQMQFWMKNTLIPLDIVFIGSDKKITRVYSNVAASTLKTSDDQVARADGFGQYVLELPDGMARYWQLKEGSLLSFKVKIPKR